MLFYSCFAFSIVEYSKNINNNKLLMSICVQILTDVKDFPRLPHLYLNSCGSSEQVLLVLVFLIRKCMA